MPTGDSYVKRRQNPPPDFFRAEAAGLAWLAAGGAPVVGVRSVDERHIELDRLSDAAPGRAAAEVFGQRLGATHRSGADHFGAAPDGFTGQLYIGNRPMPTNRHRSWGEFYIEDRVLPFLAIALAAGSVAAAQRPDIDAACELVATGRLDDNEAPARLHGDLWSGNVMWTPEGVVLIDPAAHGGHRETDLAMLALFGCPHLDAVLAGYEATHPLRAGWRERVPLHQLHPLAVHAAGYGPGYGRALHRAALETLELR